MLRPCRQSSLCFSRRGAPAIAVLSGEKNQRWVSSSQQRRSLLRNLAPRPLPRRDLGAFGPLDREPSSLTSVEAARRKAFVPREPRGAKNCHVSCCRLVAISTRSTTPPAIRRLSKSDRTAKTTVSAPHVDLKC